MSCRHVLPLQEHHDILNILLLRPALPDALHALLPNIRHADQLVRSLFYNLQCLFSKGADYQLREFRSNTLDKAGVEIILHTVDVGG